MTEKEFKIKVLPLSSQVFPMAKRLLITEDAAKDAVQLSMLKLWENRHKLNECDSITAFVFRVVRNTCLDEIKRKRPVVVNDFSFAENRLPAQMQYEEKEAVAIVRKIVEELPQGQREVLQMRDIDGLEFSEISEILTSELPYIRVLLSRARKAVKEKMEKIYDYEAVKVK